MVEQLQSGDQNMASKDSAWQTMSHFCEIGCTLQMSSLLFGRFPTILFALSISSFGTPF